GRRAPRGRRGRAVLLPPRSRRRRQCRRRHGRGRAPARRLPRRGAPWPRRRARAPRLCREVPADRSDPSNGGFRSHSSELLPRGADSALPSYRIEPGCPIDQETVFRRESCGEECAQRQ
ncbi:MAG: hypothetical protein FJ275_10485, partial [Planctomycetes bacterium]|nr:hypothetical protein [Planctomycetota bacterium]